MLRNIFMLQDIFFDKLVCHVIILNSDDSKRDLQYDYTSTESTGVFTVICQTRPNAQKIVISSIDVG